MKTRNTIFWATLSVVFALSFYLSENEITVTVAGWSGAFSLLMLYVSTEPLREYRKKYRKKRARREAYRRR